LLKRFVETASFITLSILNMAPTVSTTPVSDANASKFSKIINAGEAIKRPAHIIKNCDYQRVTNVNSVYVTDKHDTLVLVPDNKGDVTMIAWMRNTPYEGIQGNLTLSNAETNQVYALKEPDYFDTSGPYNPSNHVVHEKGWLLPYDKERDGELQWPDLPRPPELRN